VKVLNAQTAGASGVIIFNEGNPGRTAVIDGGILVDANGNLFTATIPVVFASFAVGQSLYDQSLGGPVSIALDVS
jgi:hypothetical protein